MAKRASTRATKFGIEVFDEALRERLTEPGLVAEPLRELFEEAAQIGKRTATDAVDGGKGIAVRSIGSRIKPLELRVFSAMPRARASSIEKGRPPGQRPPLGQIIRWKDAVGHPETGYEIVQDIQRKGVKGKEFMAKGRAAVNAALPRLFADMGRKVAARLGR